MNILKELQTRFATVLADFTDSPGQFAAMVRPAGDSRFGDYQANCAMPLAKQQGTNPREVALSIVDKLEVSDLCEPPEIAGPGFINLKLRDDVLTRLANEIAGDSRLGVEPVSGPKTIVIDYSSPNVAKPMHVGHLRSTVIGDALYRLFQFLGHKVISDNHIGDWGTQFGMIIYGYKHFLNKAAYEEKPVDELARLYRLVNTLCDYHEAHNALPELKKLLADKEQSLAKAEQELAADKDARKKLKKFRSDVDSARDAVTSAEKKIAVVKADEILHCEADVHPDIVRLSRVETAKLHAGDPENRQLWEQFLPQCLDALNEVYLRLGVRFDLTLGESHYDPQLPGVVGDLEAHGLAQESDGAKCVFVEGHAAPFLIQKADGAYTYATTDLATIRDRVDRLKADAILYVVDARQSDHFSMLFNVARRWGYQSVVMEHLKFGTVNGKDGKPYKTRAGDTVGLSSLLDEAVGKALEIVAANDDSKTDLNGNPAPELDQETRNRIAEIVGLGSIKYADLHHNRESDYIFDWDKMLAMTGDTAAYMQYGYARIQGILRKGEVSEELLFTSGAKIQFTDSAERGLALRIARFPEALDAAAAEYRPNFLTQYLFDLAGDLTQFYTNCHVLKAEDPQVRMSRLQLVSLTGRVIRQGLSLLGIQVSDRM